ncbi:unnamed protein product [Schistocephalus solidus]|uniref:Uncharacterized protein n=1 Tax=Schistocephalus solidus TaxID=70667 RepID=A0A183TNB3_SCHSO|nr:unnamed protein product [Schistocephalus solidus]
MALIPAWLLGQDRLRPCQPHAPDPASGLLDSIGDIVGLRRSNYCRVKGATCVISASPADLCQPTYPCRWSLFWVVIALACAFMSGNPSLHSSDHSP